MARVLLAWELGGHYGHLVALRALARELRGAGHDCVFAVRMLGAAQELLDPALGRLVQAPLRVTPGSRRLRRQLSYASLLHNIGFNQPTELAGRIQAWRSLFEAFRIDTLFADHSPIALVAARTLGIPAVRIGNGFTLPPAPTPFPAFDAHGPVPEPVLLRNERAVLRELNHALALLKLPALPVLQDIFRGSTAALLTYAPLDHYGGVERSEAFLGLPDFSFGQPPRWPEGKGPRVFAYLQPNAALPLVLEALQRSRARVLLRLPGSAAAAAGPLRAGMALASGPVHFRAAAESCDAYVNYGAHSTVAEFLLAGKPGILVPDLHERAVTARRASALGAALSLKPARATAVRRALERVLEDPAPRRAAAAFADRYAGQDRQAIVPRIVRAAF